MFGMLFPGDDHLSCSQLPIFLSETSQCCVEKTPLIPVRNQTGIEISSRSRWEEGFGALIKGRSSHVTISHMEFHCSISFRRVLSDTAEFSCLVCFRDLNGTFQLVDFSTLCPQIGWIFTSVPQHSPIYSSPLSLRYMVSFIYI